MKTIVNGLTVTLEETAIGYTATATFEGHKIITLTASSSRDYAAVAALFDAIKCQAIENLKEQLIISAEPTSSGASFIQVSGRFHREKDGNK